MNRVTYFLASIRWKLAVKIYAYAYHDSPLGTLADAVCPSGKVQDAMDEYNRVHHD